MSLLQHLQSIKDPRMERTRRHELQSMLAVALCATIAGADNWAEVAEFGEQHQDWFARFIPLPGGIASHDTFARVFRLLDAQQLEQACQQWLAQVAGQVQGTVAIDGKSVRGSRKGDAPRALHLVSAWAADMGLLLGQRKVDGKSNEITAIPELLRLLHLKGCIVTIDAMGCQRAIAEQLHTQGADYVLGLKANQRHMHPVVQKHFETLEDGVGDNTCAEGFTGHGRQEQRRYRVCPVPEALQRAATHWSGLSSVVQVVRQRQQTGHAASEEVSYYLSSLPAHTDAQHPGALEHREPVALEPGRGPARGCCAELQGPGAPQPGPAAAHGLADAQERHLCEDRRAGQAQARWVESALSGAPIGYRYLDVIALVGALACSEKKSL